MSNYGKHSTQQGQLTMSCHTRAQRHPMKHHGSRLKWTEESTFAHHTKLTCRTHYHGIFTKQLSAMYVPRRIIKHKFQVKKSLSQRLPEAREKHSVFAPLSCSFSKPLLMVARNRISAETGFCSDTSEAAFIFLFHTLDQGSVYTAKPKFTFWISQWRGGIRVSDQEHKEKAKQLSSDAGTG